jgi:hypothetical protein
MEPDHRKTVFGKITAELQHWPDAVLIDIRKQEVLHSFSHRCPDCFMAVGVEVFQVKMGVGVGQDHGGKITGN